MLDQAVIDRIRTIFLHQRPHVSIAEATDLLGWSRDEMSRAISAREVEVESAGEWIGREELMAKALELWTLEEVEEALGADADAVLPPALRLTGIELRLPSDQVAMLERLAEREGTTVSAILTSALDRLVRLNRDELSRAVPGLDEALEWPKVGAGRRPS